jgi:predicted AlkP superfamily pyrophosphatase or phosphodiesterase
MMFPKKFLALVLATSLLAFTAPVRAGQTDDLGSHNIKHVLLISVDGLHALDLSNYVNTHADSTLALLSKSGVTYTNASTSTPSDSFPGLAALVTGGSPGTTGLWYDVTYNRALSPPAMTTSLPITGGPGLCPNVVGTPSPTTSPSTTT